MAELIAIEIWAERRMVPANGERYHGIEPIRAHLEPVFDSKIAGDRVKHPLDFVLNVSLISNGNPRKLIPKMRR